MASDENDRTVRMMRGIPIERKSFDKWTKLKKTFVIMLTLVWPLFAAAAFFSCYSPCHPSYPEVAQGIAAEMLIIAIEMVYLFFVQISGVLDWIDKRAW